MPYYERRFTCNEKLNEQQQGGSNQTNPKSELNII